MNDSIQTEVVVVGSGPGGAGVTRDLTRAGKKVTVVEMGKDVRPTGTAFGGALRYTGGLPGALSLKRGLMLTKEWLTVLRGVTTGGSSLLFLGTAYDPDPDMWTPFGFDLQQEAAERKEELQVATLPDHLIGAGAHDAMKAAQDLGYPWDKLPKFIDAKKCIESCNVCIYGCPHGAKWQARDWVLDAVTEGATLLTEHACEQVLTEGEAAVGIRARRADGSRVDIMADKIVIAAGGIGSPAILNRSGIAEAGREFFFDPFVMTTGVFDRPVGQGVMMATGMRLKEEGVVLSDMQYPWVVLAVQGMYSGRPLAPWRYRTTLPIMIKIRDDMSGVIDGAWQLDKKLTPEDRQKLARGQEIASQILQAAGAREIWHTRPGAAHPGGTCAMGKVVDNNLRTRLDNLYVCDASVVPVPFGIPPTLTCLALSKRLGRHLIAQLAS